MYDPLGLERMVLIDANVYGFDNTVTLDAISKLGQQRARGVAGISPDIDSSVFGYGSHFGLHRKF